MLLDIKMRRVNGFEVLKFVKENSPGARAIMMASFVDLKNAAESKRLGANDLIAKPYDLGDLPSTIARTPE